jgi:hypothetical protein
MAKFEEVAFGSYPVLRAPRKDGAVLIATRVPLGDVRLQNWGWVLALSNQSNPAQDDIDTLTDRSGKRYPKVYYLQEVQNYAELWACSEWELGYHHDDNATWIAKSNGVAGSELVRENVFQEALGELEIRQTAQLETFQNQLLMQVSAIDSQVGESHTKISEALAEITINSHNRLLDQFRVFFEDTRRQVSSLGDELTKSIPAQESALHEVVLQTQKMREDTLRGIEGVSEGVKEQGQAVQNTITAEIGQAHQDNRKLLETMQTGLDVLTVQMKSVQESVGKIWDVVNPTIDLDADAMKADATDVASTAASAAKKATSRIERMAANLTGLSSSYYKNANEQSKRSFELARIISFIGGIILLVSLISVFGALYFHLSTDTLIFNGIGAIVAAIVEGIAGLNLIYDKATKQFTRSQIFLDRIQRSSMAFAMAENMPDEARRQETFEKITLELISIKEGLEAKEQEP